jgi:hypothetical protein
MIEQKLKNMVIWTTSIQCKMRKKMGFYLECCWSWKQMSPIQNLKL